MEDETRLMREEIAINTDELDDATLQNLVQNNRELQEEISISENNNDLQQENESENKKNNIKENSDETNNEKLEKLEKFDSELREKE
jgi:hypothetical protein